MPPLTGKDMSKLLKKHGWIKERQKGSHQQFYKNGVRITVPIHANRDLDKGLENQILKDAGLKK